MSCRCYRSMSSGGSYSTPVAVKEERLLCCGRARSMTEQDIASLYSLLEVSSLSGYHKLLRRPKAVRERHLTSVQFEHVIIFIVRTTTTPLPTPFQIVNLSCPILS
ncbi:hypothetical protein M8J76_003673 [Diaphorina citri]|nr:hypothetical protein M8J75_005953 [Diaphorina citri]KAI5736477.1 hypothetical protein M8J76_003673 [Diaphorina citri]